VRTILGLLFTAGRTTEEKTAATARRLAGNDPRVKVYVMPADWVESTVAALPASE
jgi:hypothetical protein